MQTGTVAVPQLKRYPWGGAKFFEGGATNLCLFVEHELHILISKLLLISKKKVIAPNWLTFIRVLNEKKVIEPTS